MGKCCAGNDASRPSIGVGCDNQTGKREYSKSDADYYEAVWQAGGMPLLVPTIDDDAYCRDVVRRIDGLLLPGGDDVHPHLFGQDVHPKANLVATRRQEADLKLIRAALDADLPLLGICYCAQVINVVLGGDMIQDIEDETETQLPHRRAWPETAFHDIIIEPGTILADIIGAGEIEVNSAHHQANLNVAAPLIVSARAPDGIIECVESTQHGFVLGVQWHPERLADRPEHLALFKRLVHEARRRRAISSSNRK